MTVLRPAAPRPRGTAPALAPSVEAARPDAAPPAPPERLLAPEVAATLSARGLRDEVEPLTADLRRLGITVSARFLGKLAAARDGLSHARPGATTEQVLEAALDLLLERQARRQALVKRPRAARPLKTPKHPATSPRATPAAVEREVRLRDRNRCQFRLEGGGVCGSTLRVQLDHVQPIVLGGPVTAANLRCLCAAHNRRAAELELGPVVARGARPRGPRRR